MLDTHQASPYSHISNMTSHSVSINLTQPPPASQGRYQGAISWLGARVNLMTALGGHNN